jgi:hypothetical protein
VIDYATKYCLAVTIGPTSRAQDAVARLHAAKPRPNGSPAWTTCATTAG